jgi:hypothetical protein
MPTHSSSSSIIYIRDNIATVSIDCSYNHFACFELTGTASSEEENKVLKSQASLAAKKWMCDLGSVSHADMGH